MDFVVHFGLFKCHIISFVLLFLFELFVKQFDH